MHLQFASIFVDPVNGEPLQLEISERQGDIVLGGAFRSSRATFPIINGIPRFVPLSPDENYARNFGYQWNKWATLQFDSANSNGPMRGYSEMMWEKITAQTDELKTPDQKSQVVLDIGCGSGRFIEIARNKGAKVVGIDFSLAVEAARENFAQDPDVCICQADALALPFLSGSFDGAYSIGVLHHTPNPELGVQEANRVVRPGGWFGLCVYGKGGYYDFPSVQIWRKLFSLLWPIFGHYPALIYSYFTVYAFRPLTKARPLSKLVRGIFPFVNLADIRWSLLDTFDSVTPTYQSAHESFEVYQWFQKCGFEEIAPSNWGFTAYHAQKPWASSESLARKTSALG